MKNPIKILDKNTLGRDFVIGDLHGSYTLFEKLLKEINFDPEIDRITSVGDLVDRGPDSLKCLSLIRQQWFESVLANHEHMMLEKFKGGYIGNYWYRNGGYWGDEAVRHYINRKNSNYNIIPNDDTIELIDLIPLVDELPFLITINTRSGKKFHVLHAELPTSVGPITDDILADPDKVMELATTERGDGFSFLWYRNLFYGLYSTNLGNRQLILDILKGIDVSMFNDNLSHIISGHTILQRPVTIVGQTNIDTGAYNTYYEPPNPYGKIVTPPDWACLTCVELDAWKFYQVTEYEFREVEPFVITKDEL